MKLRTLLRSSRGSDRLADPAPAAAPTEYPAPAAVPADAAAPASVEDAVGASADLSTGIADPEPVADAAGGPEPVAEAEDAAAPAEPFVRVIEPSPETADLLRQAEQVMADEGIFAAIDLLTAANRVEREPFVEHRLVHLRHEAFEHLDATEGRSVWPPVAPDRFPGLTGVPRIDASELDADILASAITNHGCLLVRGLIDPAGVARMVADIDRAFDASAAKVYAHVGTEAGSWFQPFRPTNGAPPVSFGHRWWVQEAGGVLAGDSPPAFFTMAEIFEEAGLREVVAGYLGEPPVLSLDKCTLRRVPLGLTPPEWHQDGQFLGEGIRVLNVWLALSPCGGTRPSPGLDVVPKRFDEIVETGTDGAMLDWAVGHGKALQEAADAPIERPEFDAGDALLFDELFLHRTAMDDTMTEERYAIESWFFAPSSYPFKNAPLVF